MEGSSPSKEILQGHDGQENQQEKDAASQKPTQPPTAIEEPKPAAEKDDEHLKGTTKNIKDKSQLAPVVDIQSLQRSSIQIFGGQSLSLPQVQVDKNQTSEALLKHRLHFEKQERHNKFSKKKQNVFGLKDEHISKSVLNLINGCKSNEIDAVIQRQLNFCKSGRN